MQVAFFDAAESQWRLDGLTITDAKFSAADRSLSFLMMANRLAPVTVWPMLGRASLPDFYSCPSYFLLNVLARCNSFRDPQSHVL